MIVENDELAQAIVFYGDDGAICKEMLYSEFEALLDGIVPSTEWANQQAKAVYVEVDNNLKIQALVFFLISFTAEGEIDANWNLPLANIAKRSTVGPDLGGGQSRLACLSQCPIATLRDYLWDPVEKTGCRQLSQLVKTVARNKLCFTFSEAEDEFAQPLQPAAPSVANAGVVVERKMAQDLRKEYAQEFRDHMSQLLKDQTMSASAIQSKQEQEMHRLRMENAAKINEYIKLLDESKQRLADEKRRSEGLQDTIDAQNEKINGLKDYYEHKLQKAHHEERDSVQALKDSYISEMESGIELATQEMQAIIDMRDVEIENHQVQEKQLHEEISRLRSENSTLKEGSADKFKEKLAVKGVNFVTYQPGAGHITIPADELERFMASPTAYAAEHCGVKKDHYELWLEHYQAPVCKALNEHGDFCGCNIDRIPHPADFHVGEGDRCEAHRQMLPSLLDVRSKVKKFNVAGTGR